MTTSYRVPLCFAFLLMCVSGIKALACYDLSSTNASPSERQLLRNFSQVIKCNGVSSFLLVPYLWSPISLDLNCGTLQTVSGPGFGWTLPIRRQSVTIIFFTQYQVYVASSADALALRYQNREQAWCTLSSVFGPGCQLQLSPFTTSYIGIRKYMNTGGTAWTLRVPGSCRARNVYPAQLTGWV
jgi:hypothetical protein